MRKFLIASGFAGVAISALAVTACTTAAPAAPVAATSSAPAPTQTIIKKVVHNKTVIVQPGQPAAPAQPAQPGSASSAGGNCGSGVTAGPNTSCSFALNVRANFTGPGLDVAYSPVTGQTYDMECVGTGPVECTGGNGASVYF
jgi:hypothetical protein